MARSRTRMVGSSTPGNPYGHGVRETVPHRGLPPGGDAGYHLAKATAQNYDVEWVNPRLEDDADDWQNARPIPLGYLLSAGEGASSATAGRDKNAVGWFAAGKYCFSYTSFGSHTYSDNKWRTWLDPDSDVAIYLKAHEAELVGATIVAYPQHAAGSWFYGGPQRARIDKATIETSANGLTQITFEVHDETSSAKWTKPEAHDGYSTPFSDIDETEARYGASSWTDYEGGSPKENLLWFIERQTDYLTRADATGMYALFRRHPHKMVTPGSNATFYWSGTSYNNTLMSWRCKVGGTNGTYGTFSLSVNAYATGTSLYCPTGSKFDFVWPNAGKTEFYDGSIKVNGSSVHRAADLLGVARASKSPEDFLTKLIAHLEEIVDRDEIEAKAAAKLTDLAAEVDHDLEHLREQVDPPDEKPKRKRRTKADD